MYLVTPHRFECVAAEDESVLVNCAENQYFQKSYRLAPEGRLIEWACSLFPSGPRAAAQQAAIDIGAHVGTWSLQLARQFGRVIAFEPNPHVFNVLCANIAAKSLSEIVEPWRLGLSCESGVAPYYKRAVCGGGNGLLAFDTDAAVNVTPIRISTLDREMAERVDAETFPRIALIKIDVEGHELEVLRGAEATIRHHKPKIILESWPETKQGVPAQTLRRELFEHLQNHLGYSIHPVHNNETFICDPPTAC